jgi:NADPH-dependent glutamate synthase beta subunit-like oxidoreductase
MSPDNGKDPKVPRETLDDKAKKWVRVPIAHQEAKVRIGNFKEVVKGFTKEQAIEEAGRCMHCKSPACMMKCPIHQDIPGYVSAIREGNFDKALDIVMDRNPFPACIGRTCPEFCTRACTRGKKGHPLAIAALKRAASDFGQYTPKAGPSTGKRVAIIGAGPGGLSAAYFLARWGHKVTVYERESVMGGLLYTAIPAFRLPKDQVVKDVSRIEGMGVVIKTNKTLGTDYTLSQLQKENDAVLIAIGTHKAKSLGIEGEDKKGIVHVLSFLRDVSLGKDPQIGKRVCVIGGGSAAMDAVRTAKRLGKDAWLVYRRAREQMPANKEEIVECEEEAVNFCYLTNPKKIHGMTQVEGMECGKMALGPPDESGRAKPLPVQDSDFKIDADTIIEAISQEPDLEGLNGGKFKTGKGNTFVVDENGMTAIKGIFAGGDCVIGPSTIVEALRSIKTTSIGIHKFLMGKLPPGIQDETKPNCACQK